MGELALYRKYRSRTFNEVIGQNHVVQTLMNALGSGRISHAYLFTGPRGVGKTSVARLLALSVNCSGKDNRPCGECAVCIVPLGSNMDIIEIDAASNRRIDEMRDLRDKVNIAPTIGKYKVYIIDEVHMLTTEAFNALLKTLEEPPAHVIFVLATTEAHKVPETIVSRTQRFNFKPIAMTDLVHHLHEIAAKEKIIIDKESLLLLAQASRGGFRDAISLLDQVGHSTEEPITASITRKLLGWSSLEAIDDITQAIAGNQPAAALQALDKVVSEGAQVTQITAQLIGRWREIMLVAAGASKNSEDSIRQLASTVEASRIVEIVRTLAEVTKSPLPELALETALVKLSLGTTRPDSGPATVPTVKASAAKVVAPQTHTRPAANQAPALAVSKPASQSGDLWKKALILIKEKNNSLYALLCTCSTDFSGDQLILTCRFTFHRDRLNEAKNQQVIEAALAKAYGRPIMVVTQLENAKSLEKKTDTTGELVSSALEILGGEVVDG